MLSDDDTTATSIKKTCECTACIAVIYLIIYSLCFVWLSLAPPKYVLFVGLYYLLVGISLMGHSISILGVTHVGNIFIKNMYTILLNN